MQYVNDDMDELFRKAAKDYPLNTGSADWEKVAKALSEPPAADKSSARKKNRQHLLWLLLLLPLPWICTRYIDEGGKGLSEPHTENGQTTGSARRNVPDAVTIKRTQARPLIFSEAPRSPIVAVSDRRSESYSPALSKGRKGAIGSTGQMYSSQPLTAEEKKVRSGEGYTNLERGRAEQAAPVALAGKQPESPRAVPNTLQKDTATTPGSAVQKAPQRQTTRRFYTGVIGGVDITSIEMQKVKKVGYDLGIVAGYMLNKNWSVEAGVLSSEKAYYSSGDHLYKAYLLPGTKLREAEGDCRMWEVPLVVRYHFSPGKKGGWFASAGSSSYFMQKESYDYTYYYTATGQEVKRSRSYESNSRHLFAAAQVSGGYTRTVGKTLDLRIEPYLKLPLRKVGYYELPLTSGGIHVVFTKKL